MYESDDSVVTTATEPRQEFRRLGWLSPTERVRLFRADTMTYPSVAAAIHRESASGVRIRLVPSRPTEWVSVMLETDPWDAGLEVEIPEAAGDLSVLCGVDPYDASGEGCFRSAEASPEASSGSWLDGLAHPGVHIVRRAGSPFRTPGSRPEAAPSVDPALSAQLEALGYAGVEVGAAESAPQREVGARVLPGEIVLHRSK